MAKMLDLLGKGKRTPGRQNASSEDDLRIHTENQDEELERNIKILEESGLQPEKIEKRVQKQVQDTLESVSADAATKIHIVSRGYCPSCGGKLRQHLYTSICLDCGWNQYTVPPSGPVTVHLMGGGSVQGDVCYVLKTGDILVLRREVVVARVRQQACAWIEYGWTEDDLTAKEEQRLSEENFLCSWCQGEARPENEGFHIVYLALGTHQNRYIFCSDPCVDAFRQRYPARVHRNCYETDCNACNLCVKRFDTTLDTYMIIKKSREKQARSKDAESANAAHGAAQTSAPRNV